MHRIVLAASLLAIVGVAAPETTPGRDDLSEPLKATIDDFQARYDFPGATAAIVLPDGTLVTAATGLADIESGLPMRPDTPMLAASIGKSFFAATVLALETHAVLDRTDRVAAHLGHHDWFARLPNHDTMTVGDLLRHTAGLPDHVHMESFATEMASRMASGVDALSPEGAIALVLDGEPLFPVGSGWGYSDTGYLLLGLIIEEATGQTYYEVVAERLLDPLGLDATTPSNRRHIPGLAVGYTAPDNPFGMPPRTMDNSGRLVWDPAVEWTGGGFASTSADLGRWGHLLFGGKAMAVPYIDRLLHGVAVSEDSPEIRYGAGVSILEDTPRGQVWGHGGWIPGYVSSLRHYADHGVTVAFQINTDAGVVDNSSDLVPALEAALADLAIAQAGGGEARP